MLSLVSIVAVSQLFLASSAYDPEAYMTAMEMIRYWKYPVEKHDVLTADGYILTMYRIPHGRESVANASCSRPAVVFSHGLGGDSTEFYMNPPESSPAFILADAGFDVFLINHRGGVYSKRHIVLKPWDNKFWQFTVDELSKYDCPAAIDKALSLNGQNATYWVGHSMGTSLGYMMLANNPQYNSKVKAMFMLSPSGSAGHGKGPLKYIFSLVRVATPLLDFYRNVFGAHETAWKLAWLYRPLINLCNIIPGGPQICNAGFQYVCGPSAQSLNLTRAPVYLSHAPSGTSIWNLLHYGQMGAHRRVEYFDHNPLENMQRYGQETPPPYNFSTINVPIYHFWSRNDILQTREEIDKTIMNTLRKEVVTDIEVPEYNHFDYALAVDCKQRVFDPITMIVRSRESGMCER